MGNWFKRNGIHFAIVGIFLAICFFYFTPAFQGKTLGQSDVVGAQSTQKEINDYKEKGTTILWTNQIFSGMPAFQIWAPYPNNITTWVVKGLKATFPNPIDTVLLLMLGSYLLFCVLKVNPWLAAAGAVAFTFSSYNIILLVAGHSNQAFAIAFFAPILAGIILTLRGKHLTGAALTALFLAMEIRANHIQMTYYFLLALIILLGIELYHAVKAKTTSHYIKSISYIGVSVLLAILVNASSLWSTYEYSKESYRGKSNLTINAKEPKNGLDKDYAYQWSQGVAECFTFIIPNAYGGASNLDALDVQNSDMTKALTAKGLSDEDAVKLMQYLQGSGLATYWGNKPGTSGPFYFGAVICFLFVFGLFIVRSRVKWWILATVLLTMLLSFGRNFPYLSDLFFNYFPLYNKFRAVESILAVAGLCFPILAILAIQEAVMRPHKNYILKKLKLTGYIVGGLLLLMIAVPEIFLNFKGSEHQNLISGLTQFFNSIPSLANVSAGLGSSVAQALVNDRTALERADAIRALILVALTFGLVWAYIKQKLNLNILSIALFVFVLADMWQVDKRYLKDDSFQDKVEVDAVVKPREVDEIIAKNTPDYRVFDATQSIKSDTYSPFFHKSISGYSAARLKRYDELIDNQLSNSLNQDVLDMLNVKYVINQDPKTKSTGMQTNATACGNAWFVKRIRYVKNSDQEMQVISSFAPKEEAIVDESYRKLIDEKQTAQDPAATISLTSYNPDHMVYQSGSTASMVAVFSEVYYNKGWTMLIDGKEQPYFRVDYLLRAAQIPVGNHKIEFIFHPASYYTGEGISLAGSILLVLALGGVVYNHNRKQPVKA